MESEPGQRSNPAFLKLKDFLVGNKSLYLSGVLAIIAPIILIISHDNIYGGFQFIPIFMFSSEFAYAWLMPVCGIFLLAYPKLAEKNWPMFPASLFVVGAILIAIPFIIANHWLYKFDENDMTVASLFFHSSSDSWHLYLGGIFSIISGVLAIISGSLNLKK